MTPSNAKDDAVEAVARAICEASGGTWRVGRHTVLDGPNWSPQEHPLDPCNNHWRHKARAAIEAMRAAQPVEGVTPAMTEAGVAKAESYGWEGFGADDAHGIYLAMRAALAAAMRKAAPVGEEASKLVDALIRAAKDEEWANHFGTRWAERAKVTYDARAAVLAAISTGVVLDDAR